MPIMSIDGITGSITGLVAGGLPDGTVLPKTTQVGALPSMVRVQTATNYGSTNTKIRRWTNIVVNQGSDITYADSATLGGSWTINTNGVYALSYADSFTSDTSVFGISLNTANPTVAYAALPASECLIGVNPPAGYVTEASITLYLPAGSVLRAHTNAGATTPNQFQTFSVTRVA